MNSFASRQRAQQALAIVGVDTGKFHHTLVVRPRGGKDSRPYTLPTTREGFEAAIAHVVQCAARVHPDAAPSRLLVGIELAGSYGVTFAHFLHQRGFPVVNVLASDTKRWKEVMHHDTLKTDEKDAAGITDLLSQGHYVRFAFLEAGYAELRYLVSTRERFCLQRRSAILRLKSTLEIAFPEFERIFPSIQKPTPLALLSAYPGPDAVLAALPEELLALLVSVSRNHLGAATLVRLQDASRASLALPLARGAPTRELPYVVEQIRLLDRQIAAVERDMATAAGRLPETDALLTIPGVRMVTAATFLGTVGDVRAYDSARQVVRLAGLSLVESSSGTHQGVRRLSKRGRPVLRRHAYLLALRSVRTNGLMRRRFDALVARNGGVKMKAVVALSRVALRIMYAIARDRRPFHERETIDVSRRAREHAAV